MNLILCWDTTVPDSVIPIPKNQQVNESSAKLLHQRKNCLIPGNKLYLLSIIDLLNGKIISYELSQRPVFNHVLNMLEKALKKIPDNTNQTLHSDQGWQYQITQYQHLLKKKGIMQSMFRKGNCTDNAIIENFFGLLKSELFYLKKYTSFNQSKQEITEYINYYNNDRIKLNLKGMRPIQYRAHYYET